MKKFAVITTLCMMLSLAGCAAATPSAQIAATTLPVYEFTTRLCAGTPLSVTRLVTEEVSCLHDYSLNVRQVKAAESAELIVISGAGLEEFMEDILSGAVLVDASEGIHLICPEENTHDHSHEKADSGAHHTENETHSHSHNENHSHEGHHHEQDPHIWLSPANALVMAENISRGLSRQYPQYEQNFSDNLSQLLQDLLHLNSYGSEALSDLQCRELITFHDGFAYLAQAYNLTILDAIEEESGSEASARELIHMIEEVEHHQLPAVFTEKNGSVSAAGIISRETGSKEFSLDMAMAGDSYFDAMYHNINTLKEALQ